MNFEQSLNFARIVRRYFAGANISLEEQEEQLNKKLQSSQCSALKDSYNLAKTAVAVTFPKVLALKEQRKLLKELTDPEEGKISSNSWAVIGFNVICQQYDRPGYCLPITKIPDSASNEQIIDDAKKTFEYMYSGEWMSPGLWESTYEKALKKANISENSEMAKCFRKIQEKHYNKPKK